MAVRTMTYSRTARRGNMKQGSRTKLPTKSKNARKKNFQKKRGCREARQRNEEKYIGEHERPETLGQHSEQIFHISPQSGEFIRYMHLSPLHSYIF